MSMFLGVTVQGTKELLAVLRKLEKPINEQMVNIITKGCIDIEADAKINCPWDSGNLRSRITHGIVIEKNNVVGIIGTNVEYAPWVELGADMDPPRHPVRGGTIPFLMPAYNKYKNDIVKKIEQVKIVK